MKVALTQSAGRLAELEPMLKERGFEVCRFPLVETSTIENADLQPLFSCPWWLFTSVAAVKALVGLKADFSNRRLGAVGGATAKALQEAGGKLGLVSPRADAASLAEAFIARGEAGPVGLPQGDRALPTLADALACAGYPVVKVTVYRTTSGPWPQGVLPNITVLTSPSAVEALPQEVAERSSLVALGPSTAGALRARGLPHQVANEASVEGVLQAIEQLRQTA